MALYDADLDTTRAPLRPAKALASALPVFTLSIFLSAFLLFSVQPLFAKMVLPKLGGSPAVWSVAMVFFQAMLLAGYGYAHLLTKRFSLKQAGIIHIAVLAAAFIFLPLALPQGWDSPPDSGQAVWLLGLFTIAVGLPFFAVAANSPLLQAWFSKTGHEHAADPYFLYGASNIGSFASLVLYVVLFEPTMVLSSQTFAWAAGFALLTALIGLCSLIVVTLNGRGEASEVPQAATAPLLAKPGWSDRLQWMALAFVPSGLLVAVTSHISTDIAAAPFLWVVPLALFLLTFVLAFARKPVSLKLLSFLVLITFALPLATALVPSLTRQVWINLPVHLGFFFLAALLAHSFLASKRPHASELTSFYLWMSFGGVVGGAVTTLVGPLLFTSVVEYPLLLLAVLLCRPEIYRAHRVSDTDTGRMFGLPSGLFLTLATIAVVGTFVLFAKSGDAIWQERSFFGVVKVNKSPDGRFMQMAHGTTLHGKMKIDSDGARPEPSAYYHRSGSIAHSLFAAQEKLAGKPGDIAVIGLGAGALLCHRKPGETWKNYEIDTAVVRAASNPALFRFVPECLNGDPIIIGDARLTLEKEQNAQFDYMLIDAFSSDSIPVHLLTVEALQLYRNKLKADGLIAIHISNRYLELESVVAAIAREVGLVGRASIIDPSATDKEQHGARKNHVVVLAPNEAALGPIAKDARWKPLDAAKTVPWTDDYSNIPAALIRQLSR